MSNGSIVNFVFDGSVTLPERVAKALQMAQAVGERVQILLDGGIRIRTRNNVPLRTITRTDLSGTASIESYQEIKIEYSDGSWVHVSLHMQMCRGYETGKYYKVTIVDSPIAADGVSNTRGHASNTLDSNQITWLNNELG